MQVLPYTCLKIHSAGLKFAPVQFGNVWRLENGAGDVLSGARGNPYNFKSQKNALTWLCTNLSRVANSLEPMNIDYIVQLNAVYSKTMNQYILTEIQAIQDYDAGLWQVVECSSDTPCDCANEPLDGGNAFSTYQP